MNDYTRITTTILWELARTMDVLPNLPRRSAAYVYMADPSGPLYATHVHLAPWIPPSPGRLVCVRSELPSDATVAWVVDCDDHAAICQLRPFGSSIILDVAQPRCTVVEGLSPYDLLEGNQRRVYDRLQRVLDSTAIRARLRLQHLTFADDPPMAGVQCVNLDGSTVRVRVSYRPLPTLAELTKVLATAATLDDSPDATR